MWTVSQRNQVRNMKGSGRQSRGRHNPEHDLEKLNELESKLRGAHIPLPHDRWPSLPSSSQVICHQNITGMLLAPSLPISSGASPCDFLWSLRCTCYPPPIPSSPVLPAGISGRKTGPETCGCLCTAWHFVPFYLPSLGTFASVLETSWVEASTPAAPPPQRWCV